MQRVSEFYTGKGIFITGGTGFVGKVLIEKLLRCFPGIKYVYLLTRPKKGQNVQERLEHILQCKLFDKLREEQPDFAQKIIPVQGNMLEHELGICNGDLEKMQKDVSIIFHSAATIKFDEPLRIAVEMNVIGVRKVVHLAKQLPNLQAFIHVSTAYSNCERPMIEELIYPSVVSPDQIIDAIGWMDDSLIDAMTPYLLKEKPNTYTFTKHLAEVLLTKEATDLPVAIVRPSIIGAVWKDPLPGWIDSFNGAAGLYVATGKGLLKSIHCEVDAKADIVPCDMVVNMLVITAWHTAIKKPKKIDIYHCTTGTLNPFTWGEVGNVVTKFFKKNPLDSVFRRPNLVMTSSSYLHDYWVVVSHLIPAYIADLGFRMVGKKPRMVHIYKKLHKVIASLNYFITHEWHWSYNSLDVLHSSMSAAEKSTFYLDPRAIDWHHYNDTFCFGAKKFILNEDENEIPAARANLKRLRNIRYCFNTIVAVTLWRVLIARSQLAGNLWYLILGLVFRFVRFLKISSTLAVQKSTDALRR